MKTTASLLTALTILLVANSASAAAMPWINGDFALGGQTWTAPAATTFVDADGDGDMEAFLHGAGDGTWQLSRGITKLPMPGRLAWSFDVEQGAFGVYSFRMIMLRLEDPEPYANNLFSLDPTGTLQPDWFDDQVLDWSGSSLSGHVVLDPVAADAYGIPGWAGMSADQRTQALSTFTHMTIVMYGYTGGFQGGATLDNFAWELPA